MTSFLPSVKLQFASCLLSAHRLIVVLTTARFQIYLGKAGMAEWKRRLLCGEDEVSLPKRGIN